MSAQHKRPGKTARLERIRRAKEREQKKQYREQVIVQFPCYRKRKDGFPGLIRAIGVPPEDETA